MLWDSCQQRVDIGCVEVVSSMHLLFSFYDVMDGFLLRCKGSGIRSVSLFVSSMLTLDGSKLVPVRLDFFELYVVVDGFLLRATC